MSAILAGLLGLHHVLFCKTTDLSQTSHCFTLIFQPVVHGLGASMACSLNANAFVWRRACLFMHHSEISVVLLKRLARTSHAVFFIVFICGYHKLQLLNIC